MTASGESMIHERARKNIAARKGESDEDGVYQGVAPFRLLWPSVLCGRRTVPFRSLSAAFLLPFLLRDSYPVGNDCTFLEFRQSARIIRIVIVIFAVWSILYFQPEHKNSSQGPGLGCRIVIDNKIIYLPFGADDKICNTVIDAGFIKFIQFITFIKRY